MKIVKFIDKPKIEYLLKRKQKFLTDAEFHAGKPGMYLFPMSIDAEAELTRILTEEIAAQRLQNRSEIS